MHLLPILTGGLPIVAIHLSLLIAISAGTVPACFPYLEGCTSISATGRYEPASFIFKPAMLTAWVLLVLYWLANAAWLRALSDQSGELKEPGRTMVVIGCIGALALILYVTFLGSQVPFYEFMRRVGIYFYFGCSVIAQVILARTTSRMAEHLELVSVYRIARWQLLLALLPFAMGIFNLVQKSIIENSRGIENGIEWIFALLMHVFFLLSWPAWKATGFDANFRVQLPQKGLNTPDRQATIDP